jgi:hypothetical protein
MKRRGGDTSTTRFGEEIMEKTALLRAQRRARGEPQHTNPENDNCEMLGNS